VAYFEASIENERGFESRWCQWIEHFVSQGTIGIKINDDIGNYFQTKKELRQGDSLTPMLFNLMADMLEILIARAREYGKVEGLIPHVVAGVCR
jgi:hypothetical protein